MGQHILIVLQELFQFAPNHTAGNGFRLGVVAVLIKILQNRSKCAVIGAGKVGLDILDHFQMFLPLLFRCRRFLGLLFRLLLLRREIALLQLAGVQGDSFGWEITASNSPRRSSAVSSAAVSSSFSTASAKS